MSDEVVGSIVNVNLAFLNSSVLPVISTHAAEESRALAGVN
jgi:hypothetical protein